MILKTGAVRKKITNIRKLCTHQGFYIFIFNKKFNFKHLKILHPTFYQLLQNYKL